MKIIWVMPRPLSGLYDNETPSSGSWIDATYKGCKDDETIELHCVSFDSKISDVQCYNDGRHKGYVVPQKGIHRHLRLIKEDIHPDLVHLWGTEHDYMIDVVNVFNDIPKIVFIQGVARNIAKNYMAGLSFSDRILNISLKDAYRKAWIGARQKDMYRTAITETSVLKACQGAILENNWTEDQIKAVAPDIRIFFGKLPLKDVFFEYRWSLETMKPHTIFTNTGGYPIKGHHTLFEAMQYVVRKYPDTILYIPGHSRLGSGFKNWIRRSTYENFLSRLARNYGIEKNIVYTGVLNSDEMAQKLIECNVFALPSWVENQSSSLLEAMVMGVPCAASVAGGVISTVENGINGLAHNPQDAECLAGNIIRIFENNDLAEKLSSNARKLHAERREGLKTDLPLIYNQLFSKNI